MAKAEFDYLSGDLLPSSSFLKRCKRRFRHLVKKNKNFDSELFLSAEDVVLALLLLDRDQQKEFPSNEGISDAIIHFRSLAVELGFRIDMDKIRKEAEFIK
jgi:hypothetical protein